MYSSATYSFESRVGKKLREWKMSLDVFTLMVMLEGVQGIGKSRLAGAIKGRLPALPNDAALRLEPFIAEIDNLVNTVSPLTLDFSNAVTTYDWLVSLRTGRMTVSVSLQQ